MMNVNRAKLESFHRFLSCSGASVRPLIEPGQTDCESGIFTQLLDLRWRAVFRRSVSSIVGVGEVWLSVLSFFLCAQCVELRYDDTRRGSFHSRLAVLLLTTFENNSQKKKPHKKRAQNVGLKIGRSIELSRSHKDKDLTMYVLHLTCYLLRVHASGSYVCLHSAIHRTIHGTVHARPLLMDEKLLN